MFIPVTKRIGSIRRLWTSWRKTRPDHSIITFLKLLLYTSRGSEEEGSRGSEEEGDLASCLFDEKSGFFFNIKCLSNGGQHGCGTMENQKLNLLPLLIMIHFIPVLVDAWVVEVVEDVKELVPVFARLPETKIKCPVYRTSQQIYSQSVCRKYYLS